MKKSLIFILSIIFTIALCSQIKARVTGVCSNCHTMHNSQGGAPMAFQINVGRTGHVFVESPNPQLLLTGCVGCHTALDGSTWKDLLTGAPIVYNTGEPTTYLAGGNFWWVAQGGLLNDPKGHNVLGLASQDGNITVAEGAPGNQYSGNCQSAGCHGTLAAVNTSLPSLGSGCQGCHLKVKHHANDGTDPKKLVNSAEQGWYRFLANHSGGDVLNYGVKGIEDSDWQHTKGTTDHNEYSGVPESGSTSLTNGSMTAFCCGCHGNFHSSSIGSGSQSPWFRHPSDFVIPNSGEYGDAFGADGSGYGIYNPDIPVARPSLNLSANQNIVTLGTDMVMCLTCHRAHGSPYYKMLRWNYDSTDLATALEGCNVCHTSKN